MVIIGWGVSAGKTPLSCALRAGISFILWQEGGGGGGASPRPKSLKNERRCVTLLLFRAVWYYYCTYCTNSRSRRYLPSRCGRAS